LGKRGDSYDRFLIRVREMYESVNIVFQLLSNLATAPTAVGTSTKVDSFTFFEFLNQTRKLKLRKLSKYTSMEALIQHFKNYSEGQSMPKGFTYNAVEAPKGEFGVTLISDGTPKPYRCKIRTPAFHHMHIMSRMAQGHYLADLVTVLGSQDIVFGDVDR
jgi:NADH-quinone oxidoreductase subunit D